MSSAAPVRPVSSTSWPIWSRTGRPKSLEAKLDEDESGAERFDFARGDYRVLIALREDYLAPLEGLKKAMPSISQNRLRLAPMTGDQALAAVLQPGKRLVTEEVASAIVRFVAGGAELAHAEVEPSLLSLICRELNDTRIAQGRDEISLDLLAGSHASILSNFYERSLADQIRGRAPNNRRRTADSIRFPRKYRRGERLLSRFNAVGAAAGHVGRPSSTAGFCASKSGWTCAASNLRMMFCAASSRSSRDLRREREAREATERLLAEQHSRELAARRALVRARTNRHRLHRARDRCARGGGICLFQQPARPPRRASGAANPRGVRTSARRRQNSCSGYLTDDFVRELQSFGRLERHRRIRQASDRLFSRAAARCSRTRRPSATARSPWCNTRGLMRLSRRNWMPAAPRRPEAVKLLEQLRAGGDKSEATTIALALGYAVQAQI